MDRKKWLGVYLGLLLAATVIGLGSTLASKGVSPDECVAAGKPVSLWSLPQDSSYETVWQSSGLDRAVVRTSTGELVFVSLSKTTKGLTHFAVLPRMFIFHDGKVFEIGNDKDGNTVARPME